VSGIEFALPNISLMTSWIRPPQPDRGGHFWGPYSAFRPRLRVAVPIEGPGRCASRPGGAFPGRSFGAAVGCSAKPVADQVMNMALANLVVGGLSARFFK
jgi:hypothetical protein